MEIELLEEHKVEKNERNIEKLFSQRGTEGKCKEEISDGSWKAKKFMLMCCLI